MNAADGYLTMADIAQRVGWPVRRVRRLLVAANARLGGKLLVRFGGTRQARFFVDAEVLRVHLPALLRGEDTRDEAAEGQRRMAALEERLRGVHDAVSDIRDALTSASS